jgi:hypothetical protein
MLTSAIHRGAAGRHAFAAPAQQSADQRNQNQPDKCHIGPFI